MAISHFHPPDGVKAQRPTIGPAAGDDVLQLRFVDNSNTKLSNADFFVNNSLDGWSRGKLRILPDAEILTQPFRNATGIVIPEPSTLLLALPAILLILASARLAGRSPKPTTEHRIWQVDESAS